MKHQIGCRFQALLDSLFRSFPSDVTEALSSGDINLQEAVQLARLTPERLGCTPLQARAIRKDILQAHLRRRGSQNVLRARVKEMLGETIKVSTDTDDSSGR